MADALLALLLVIGYGDPVTLGVPIALAHLGIDVMHYRVGPLLTLLLVVLLTIVLYRRVERHRRPARIAAQLLILVVLPLWGLGYSHFMGQVSCRAPENSLDSTPFRAFAEPAVWGWLALHAVTAIAFVVSRQRPERLRPFGEIVLHALLVVGVVMQLLIGIHVVRWSLVGVLIAPIFVPCLTPYLTIGLYGLELHARLRRRGIEQAVDLDRPLLYRALAVTPALLGLYAVAQALWLRAADGALWPVTHTCDYLLSRVPIEILPSEGHYLCTVAARGHSWLVRPERLGRRRGIYIVVNRQLAVANAFEDVLHERLPRFGRLARRIYDRLGRPIGHYLRRPLCADLVYLAMKPAECLFYLALLLFDVRDPEVRIDRMYR